MGGDAAEGGEPGFGAEPADAAGVGEDLRRDHVADPVQGGDRCGKGLSGLGDSAVQAAGRGPRSGRNSPPATPSDRRHREESAGTSAEQNSSGKAHPLKHREPRQERYASLQGWPTATRARFSRC